MNVARVVSLHHHFYVVLLYQLHCSMSCTLENNSHGLLVGHLINGGQELFRLKEPSCFEDWGDRESIAEPH